MALNRYITTARVTLAPGTFTQAGGALSGTTAWNPGTGSFAVGAGLYGSGGQVVIPKGTVLMLDPAGVVFTAIGAGNLTPWTGAQETGGTDGVAN